MALELEGRVFKILPEQSGMGQSGKQWRKQSFVIETDEQYPKKVVFNGWNNMVDAIKQLNFNDKVKVFFRVESREFNDRWYTDLTAWKITKVIEQNVEAGTPPPQTEPPADVIYNDNSNNTSAPETDITPDNDEGDDLPF